MISRVALADAGGLDQHQVKAGVAAQVDDILQHRGGGQVLAARRQRAHKHRGCAQRVHADAIAQQRPAGAAARRIHGDHGDLPVRERAHETLQQLIGQRTLAGPAGAGDADDRRGALGLGQGLAYLLGGAFIAVPAFQRGDAAGNVRMIAGIERSKGVGRALRGAHAREHVIDHAIESETAAVLGRVNLLDPVRLERGDLRG